MLEEELQMLDERDYVDVMLDSGLTVRLTTTLGDAKENEGGENVRPLVLWTHDVERLRDGESADYSSGTAGKSISLVHEDYASTVISPSTEEAAERLFEMFKTEEGRARGVAQEALHMLGYEIEKTVEYELVGADE